MKALRKIRDKLLQFSNFWFSIAEPARHAILFIFPLVLAALMTILGHAVYHGIEEYFGQNINMFWFLVWSLMMFVLIWMFAIIMDERHKLEMQMCMDHVTGVYTRSFMYEQGESLLRRASFDRKIVCVCFVDMDDFKIINDTYSHDAGDTALKIAGQALSAVMRKKIDVVGRYGGDELLAIWDTDDEDSINITYKRIVDALNHIVFTHIDQKIRITASTGLSFGRCAPDKDPEKELTKLIRQADENLKSSKKYKG